MSIRLYESSPSRTESKTCSIRSLSHDVSKGVNEHCRLFSNLSITGYRI